jgi:hypothetical protein
MAKRYEDITSGISIVQWWTWGRDHADYCNGVNGIVGCSEANKCPFFLHERKLPLKTGCATDLDPELRLIWLVPVICDLPTKWVCEATTTSVVVSNDVSLLLFRLVARLVFPFSLGRTRMIIAARQLALCPQPAASWDKAITHRHYDADRQQTPSHPTSSCGSHLLLLLLLLLFARAKFCCPAKQTVRLAGPLGGSTLEAAGGRNSMAAEVWHVCLSVLPTWKHELFYSLHFCWACSTQTAVDNFAIPLLFWFLFMLRHFIFIYWEGPSRAPSWQAAFWIID